MAEGDTFLSVEDKIFSLGTDALITYVWFDECSGCGFYKQVRKLDKSGRY